MWIRYPLWAVGEDRITFVCYGASGPMIADAGGSGKVAMWTVIALFGLYFVLRIRWIYWQFRYGSSGDEEDWRKAENPWFHILMLALLGLALLVALLAV